MIICPNKSSKIWTKLVEKYGEEKAYIYMNMPNPAVTATDYGYKIDNTLLIDVENLQVDSSVSNLIPLLTDIIDIIDYEDIDIISHNNPFISDDKIAFMEKAIAEDNDIVKDLLNVSSLNISIREWLENNDLESLFKLNPDLTYVTDVDEITKILLENNIIDDNEKITKYEEIYDMFKDNNVVSFEKRKSEWLLDIIDNNNSKNKEIAKLLLRKLNYIYDTKVNKVSENTYIDSINIQEANSYLFLQEFISNMINHIFDSSNKLNKVEKAFLNDISLLYKEYSGTEDFDLYNIKMFVVDTLLNKHINDDTVDLESKLYIDTNSLLDYEINNKSKLLNTTINTILKYFNNDMLFENIHKNKEYVKIKNQINDITTTKNILKYMELNNITIYTDKVFDSYVQSLSSTQQKQLYNILNSENRYSDRSNLSTIISNYQKTYNKIKLIKSVERRLNGNIVKIIVDSKIDITIKPESNTIVFNKNNYIFSINDKTINLKGKTTNKIDDLINYLKTKYNMTVYLNDELMTNVDNTISELDKRIQAKLNEITNTPETEIIYQCNF